MSQEAFRDLGGGFTFVLFLQGTLGEMIQFDDTFFKWVAQPPTRDEFPSTKQGVFILREKYLHQRRMHNSHACNETSSRLATENGQNSVFQASIFLGAMLVLVSVN